MHHFIPSFRNIIIIIILRHAMYTYMDRGSCEINCRVIHWQCPVVHCMYLSIPIIGKLRGFGRGVISFVPRIVSASSPRRRRRKHRKCKCENRIISLRTRNSPLCARGPRHKGIRRLRHVYVRAACRAMPCRGSCVTRNDNVSPPVV